MTSGAAEAVNTGDNLAFGECDRIKMLDMTGA